MGAFDGKGQQEIERFFAVSLPGLQASRAAQPQEAAHE
jgi:hypothetical protein